MAEWSNAPVLKTGVPKGTGGSNPSLSAIFPFPCFARLPPTATDIGCARRDRFLIRASERFLRRGLRHSNPATESGRTVPRNRRRTKTIHFAGDFRDSCRPSVRQSRREARGSVGGNLPNGPASCPPKPWRRGRPPAALHGPTPGARRAVLAARDLATPPLAGGKQPINPLRKTSR